MRSSPIRSALVVVLLIASAATGCDRQSQDIAAQKHLLSEAIVPAPAPVGRLAAAGQPAPAPTPGVTTPEPRGLVGPSGTLGLDVYRARRKKVMDLVGKAGVLVENEASWDGAREAMDFYWLTGIEEEGASLYLEPQAPRWKEILLLHAVDVEDGRWNGDRALLPSKAMEVSSGIARVVRDRQVGALLLGACDRAKALAFIGTFTPFSAPNSPTLEKYHGTTGHTLGCAINDLHGTLAKLRQVHDTAELALMRKAIDITALGQQAAIRAAQPGAREFEVKDAVEDAFRKGGSRHLAFDSITGSGPNSAVLHYPKDDRVLQAGELIVVDIGAEAEHYAADITRTLPIGGKYTKDQREIYDVVLRAQAAGIAKARAGATIAEVDAATREVVAAAGYYDYYIHSCCHFVGLQVHDVGDQAGPLVPGTVITVEPGIYLPQQGFGIRIEDEVLITDGDAEVLSKGIPKDPDEIERLMGEAHK